MEEYKEPFCYSADWYDRIYHEPLSGQTENSGDLGQYKDRDGACLDAMCIKDGASILVPGCDRGQNINLLQSKYKNLQILGFDWSKTAIDFCESAFPGMEFKQVCLDMWTGFSGSCFDHIVAFDFIEHLSLLDYCRFLYMCNHVLKVGSTVGVVPGMTLRPEHINLMYTPTIANHLWQFGIRPITCTNDWVVGKKL